jgi:hypothetical protein
VEAQQCVQLTGTNRSSGLIPLITPCPTAPDTGDRHRAPTLKDHASEPALPRPEGQEEPRRSSPAWWPRRSSKTRSHPELGRQTLQRPWYCASRPGRVGRRQARQDRRTIHSPRHRHSGGHTGRRRGQPPHRRSPKPRGATCPAQDAGWCPAQDAGWSSPVARQAHNLKAAGSNPAPATKHPATDITPAPSGPRPGPRRVLEPDRNGGRRQPGRRRGRTAVAPQEGAIPTGQGRGHLSAPIETPADCLVRLASESRTFDAKRG